MDTKTIEILVRGVCVKRGRLLLCHTQGAGNTYLPGGHVEFGEPARKALAREMIEETGLTAHVGRFLGAVEHTFVQKGRLMAEVNLIFEMTIEGLETDRPVPTCESHLDFRWVPMDSLDDACLEPAHIRRLLSLWLADEGIGVERWAEFTGKTS